MQNPEKKFERKNDKLHKYTYTDHSGVKDIVVFETIAKTISEADKKYEEGTGKNPENQNYVGCNIEEIEPKNNL